MLILSPGTPKSLIKNPIRRVTCSFAASKHSGQLQCRSVMFVPSHFGQRWGLSSMRMIFPHVLQDQKACLTLQAVGMELASMSKISSAPFHSFSSMGDEGLE